MSLLFGHPTGNPNSHHAALAHFEAGRLEAFCVPWMPSPATLSILGALPGLGGQAARLRRRWFPPLAAAPKIQGRAGEWWRLAKRVIGRGDESLSYEANDWLMRTMARECRRPSVTAVHAFEDCSLWQFEEARRLGKACIYDMPIGYYPAWERTQADLVRTFADWLPSGGLPSSRFVRPDQKRKEMELADLVMAPGSFVRRTIEAFCDKKIALAPYGVDLDFWRPASDGVRGSDAVIRFLYAGPCSLRKGVPILLNAWRALGLKDAELELAGSWQLSEARKQELPSGVRFVGPLSREDLRARYRAADVFVFPSFFEGFGLVLLEAMACGIPVVTTDATAGPDIVTEDTGRVTGAGDLEALMASLRWFAEHREALPVMKAAARRRAEMFTWEHYRKCVSQAVGGTV